MTHEPDLLAQALGPPPAAVWVACVACVLGPAIGLCISLGSGRRPAPRRWCVAAAYGVLVLASFSWTNEDAAPGEPGYEPAMAFCVLLPVGGFVGLWFALAPGRRPTPDAGDR